ncbi:6-phospho-beta-glucosidase [Aerococcaceae bacterium WGS1372]
MAKGIKIVTIGGGSSYTPELIEGYIKRKDELPIEEIVLVDIEAGQDKLNIVGEMAKRMVKAAGLDWKITLTLDRFTALKDADFVTTQFRVGLLDARVKDERIPLSHGLLGQETNGAGGMLKAFRIIPVIGSIIEDMREQCPNAWLINFTNPAGMVTEAAIKQFGWKKTIGLCNVPITHCMDITEQLDVDQDDLFFQFAGMNHFHWHKVWDRQGNDITKKVIDLLYKKDEDTPESALKNIHDANYNIDQIRDLGMLPCGYHRYYYSEDEMLEHSIEEFKAGQTRAQVVKETEKQLFELYKDPDLDHKPEELTQRGGTYYSDAACEVIASIYNDKRTVMVVSTENNGTIRDLPYDAIVEVSAEITSHGAVPYNWGTFMPAARGMLQLMKAMEETTIRAAIDGDYGAALHAFTINPLVRGGAIAKRVLDELLYAHKEHLPQFADKIAEIEANQAEVIEYVDELMKSN